MSPIRCRSSLQIPGAAPPLGQARYEIGDWFATIYYADTDVDPHDAARCHAIARLLQGSLGEKAPLFLNQHHPSIPLEHTAGSTRPGTLQEMHSSPPQHKHVHLELIGTQREIGFARLGVLDVLRRHLEMAPWDDSVGACASATVS